MSILHYEKLSATRERHWANDVEDETAEGYKESTHYIIQTDTGIKYDEAVDPCPCRHIYEATDEKIEPVHDAETIEE